MTRNEAIFELIKYRRRLEENPTIIFGRGSFDADPFDMAIEALERKNGEWIPHPLGKNEMSIDRDVCSICGVQLADAWMFDYCPICGSYMRGDND